MRGLGERSTLMVLGEDSVGLNSQISKACLSKECYHTPCLAAYTCLSSIGGNQYFVVFSGALIAKLTIA